MIVIFFFISIFFKLPILLVVVVPITLIFFFNKNSDSKLPSCPEIPTIKQIFLFIYFFINFECTFCTIIPTKFRNFIVSIFN